MMTSNTSERNAGTVYLIGSGPGHPGLITVMGKELLKTCDAVVYDDLSAQELIATLPDSIKLYYVGKRYGKHSKPQHETNELLVNLARTGDNVGRLKGGDPLIFGRGGEEASFLRKKGVNFVIIPGVTAMNAAAAGAGIPLTDRRTSSWVTLATGHEASSGSPAVPWEQFAELHGGTIAIYMGVNELPNLVKRLTNGGMSAHTPTAIVQDGYNPAQRIIMSDLSTIVDTAEEQDVRSPSLIFIGDAVSHSTELNWMNPQKLSGKRVLVTRPAIQSAKISRILRSHGSEPLVMPTIDFKPVDDGTGWKDLENLAAKGGWMIFTSGTGVRYFYDQLFDHDLDIRICGNFKIAAIGPGTSCELRKIGLSTDLKPRNFTVKGLAGEFLERLNSDDQSEIIRIRGVLSDETIEQRLQNINRTYKQLTVYDTIVPKWEEHQKLKIVESPPDFLVFTSGSTVDGFVEIMGEDAARTISERSVIISIGPVTSETIQKYGLRPGREAKVHTVDGIIETLLS